MFKTRIIVSIIIVFSVCICLYGCKTTMVSAQYVERPVIIGPVWKIKGKPGELPKTGGSKFSSEVHSSVSVSETTTHHIETYKSMHKDMISLELSRFLELSGKDSNNILKVDKVYIGSYNGLGFIRVFGGIDGRFIKKPK